MIFLDSFRPRVEAELREIVQKGTAPPFGLDVMNSYHMGFCDREGNIQDQPAGKYMRPLFCIAMCAGLGGNPEQAIPAATALELVHRTSLIFDDIQDKGKERNNQPTVWAIWGADQAINAGLALSSYARLATHRLTSRNVPTGTLLGIQKVLETAVIELCHGQYMDISFADSVTVGVEDYLRMVRGKTGALFGAACSVGAMLTSIAPSEAQDARDFGINMGLAFQIHDDFLGIWGDESQVGKTANDLQEKKRTLPVILALEIERDNVGGWLEHSPANENEVRILKNWMEEKGIPGKVRQMEADFIKAAREKLDALPLNSKWRREINEFLAFVVSRKV